MNDILGVFKPETKTVKSVFGEPSSYYQIPDYQRPYDWGDEEIQKLWDDIYSAFDSGDQFYFLGPVVLAETKDGYLEVVDGQQRLTTLTILFCVIRDFYFKRLKKKDQILKNQISDAVESLVKKQYRLRLITQAQYHNRFEHEILKKVMLPQEDLTKKQKEKLKYKFMNAASVLKNFLDGIYEDFGIRQIRKLARFILDDVVFITITCSNRVSAIKIFQIINTRGLELSLADLVKSSLLAKLDDEKKHIQFMASWREIEKTTEDNDESVSDFLTYYAYYSFATKPKRSLYEEFQEKFKKKKPNQVIYEFQKFTNHLDLLLNEKSKVIYTMKLLPDKVFWKVILVTAKMEGFRRFASLCKELRRFYFSYWIAGYTTAKTRNFSYKLVKLIKDKKTLAQIKKEIKKKMNEDEVVDYARDNLENDVYGESWLKPLLILIEYEQTDESVFIEYSRKLHVDHILPGEWKKKSDWRKKWTDDQANFWLHKMGNLTLLTGKKNIQASNKEFSKKKKNFNGKGIDGTTGFEISKRILKRTNWTEKEVKKRHKWLIRQTANILEV